MVATTQTSAKAAAAKSPVDIARVALTKLAQSALPPTPENYVREYRRASGQPDAALDELHPSSAFENTEALLSLVETITQITMGLTDGIDRFGGDLKALVGAADSSSPEGARIMVEQLTALGLTLVKKVEESRVELDTTRKRLDQVTAELESSRAQAHIDPLTGSINRRGMEVIIGREIALARRTKTPFSLAILDIDHFKRVNDEHGHDTGDLALVHLVAILKAGLRETDVVCRYGGEEFVVILPGSDVEGALLVVDRLRAMVEDAGLSIASSTLQICISAGVAELTGDEDRDALLKRADTALYAAKRAGRNRVFSG